VLRVLAVDDNPDNVELIADIIGALGYDVVRAFDGQQALDSVSQQIPDLVLLDVNMPGMSGFDVLRELRADEATAQLPVILLTALADIEYRVEGLDLGADDYLTKPYSPRELIARIETRLRTKSHADDLREKQKVIRATFERFVSASVVNQMLEDPTAIKLGGKMQEVSVLFADIQGFTSTSEHTDPEKLLNILNQYHELIVHVIQSKKGTIDKFIGDAVMALYNTPLEVPDHALLAVKSAIEIRDALVDFHPQFDEMFRWNINFGIHTGMAVVGNVGSSQIMDFTAVGDTVNVAARLQGQSDDGQILISGATFEHVKSVVDAHPLGSLTFKGRRVPVETYDVIALLD